MLRINDGSVLLPSRAWRCDSDSACTTLRPWKMKHLNWIQPSSILLFTPVFSLVWRVKMSSVEKGPFRAGLWLQVLSYVPGTNPYISHESAQRVHAAVVGALLCSCKQQWAETHRLRGKNWTQRAQMDGVNRVSIHFHLEIFPSTKQAHSNGHLCWADGAESLWATFKWATAITMWI